MEEKFLKPILLATVSATTEEINQHIAAQTKKLNSQKIITINPENTLKINQVRTLQSELKYGSKMEVTTYVLSAIDQASLPAMNALLKILEEPPENILFILTAKNIDQVLPTIQSRCVIKYLQTKKNETDSTKIITDFSYQNIITFAKEHKSLPDAQKVLGAMVQRVHQELENQPNSQVVIKKQMLLLQALQDLQTATSPQLVLEHCFFEMKKVDHPD